MRVRARVRVRVRARFRVGVRGRDRVSVSSKTLLKCSGAPAPLLAMTGTLTAALMERSSGRSWP